MPRRSHPDADHPPPVGGRCCPRGFSLLELTITVIIIAVIAAIAVPRTTAAVQRSRTHSFARTLQVLADAAERYREMTGEWPEDSSSGECPVGLDEFVVPTIWERPTPLGGDWDFDREDFDVRSAVGVHFRETVPESVRDHLLAIDVQIDDGRLDRGRFRRLESGRYYLVLEELPVADRGPQGGAMLAGRGSQGATMLASAEPEARSAQVK